MQTEHSAAADAVIDSVLAALAEGEKKWSRQSLTGSRALLDRVRTLTGQHAQDWVDAAVDIKGLDPAGLAQLGPTRTGGIAAVLGAGNISSIAPLDTIYELIAHNRVVALKLNPVTDPLLPVFERIFAPLIELG